MQFEFRPLMLKDLPLLHRWFQEEHIRAFYDGHKLSKAEIWKKYLPRIQGQEKVHCFVIETNHMPIGFVQFYDAKAFATAPQLKTLFKQGFQGKSVASIDWFLAKTPFLSKGYSHLILRQFLRSYIFKDFNIALVDPNPENERAIKSYERAGFVTLKVLETSIHDKIQLMILFKETFNGQNPEPANENAEEDDEDVYYIDA